MLIVRVALILLLFSYACASHPAWVHRTPAGAFLSAGASANEKKDPAGRWIRAARNVYPVAHPDAYSDSREWIEIHSDRTYIKMHFYAEVANGGEKLTVFRESGNIVAEGIWILMKPEKAEYFETAGPVQHPRTKIDPVYPFPDPSGIRFSSVRTAEPLLYLLDRDRGRDLLMPLAFERNGRIFDFGLYEGSESDYDVISSHFQSHRQTILERRFQPSYYVRVRD